jgi:hypothetical protein
MKLLLMPVPCFDGFNLYQSWSRLPLHKRFRTIFGTVRRLLVRASWKRQPPRYGGLAL